MKVKTEELEKMMKILCKHLEENGYNEVDIPQSLYWSIPKKYEYDLYNKPTSHTLENDLEVGDLDDDWAELGKISDGTNDPTGYHLVWLASVLRAVGQNVVC